MITIFYACVLLGFFIGPLKMQLGGWLPYVLMDALTVSLLLVSFASKPRSVPGLPDKRVTLPFLLFAAYCMVEILNPHGPMPRSVMGYRSLVLYTALFLVGYRCLNQRRHLLNIYWFLIGLGVVTAVLGIWQWSAGPAVLIKWQGWYEHYAEVMAWNRSTGELVFRSFSTFVQPGVFGSNMASIMLLALTLVLSPSSSMTRRVVLAVALCLTGTGLLLSGSRSDMFFLCAGALVIFMLRGRAGAALGGGFLLVSAVGVGILFAGSFFLERLGSIFARQVLVEKWSGAMFAGLGIALEQPFGMGLGYTGGIPTFTGEGWFRELPTRSIDSGIGSMAAELGLPGVTLFLYFLFRLCVVSRETWRTLPRGPDKDLLAAPAAFAILSLFVSPLWNPLRASVPLSIYNWFLIGVLLRFPYLSAQADEPSADPPMRGENYGALRS